MYYAAYFFVLRNPVGRNATDVGQLLMTGFTPEMGARVMLSFDVDPP